MPLTEPSGSCSGEHKAKVNTAEKSKGREKGLVPAAGGKDTGVTSRATVLTLTKGSMGVLFIKLLRMPTGKHRMSKHIPEHLRLRAEFRKGRRWGIFGGYR